MQPQADDATKLQDTGMDDPWTVLQLHPRAPRELIERVYWHLAGTAQKRDDEMLAAGEVARLNAAYGTLVDAMRDRQGNLRPNPDLTRNGAANGYAPATNGNGNGNSNGAGRKGRRGLFGAKRDVIERHAVDAYETLRVHRAAGADVLQIAYTFRRAQLKGTAVHADELETVERAYAMLTDAEQRATYDRINVGTPLALDDRPSVAERIAALSKPTAEAPSTAPAPRVEDATARVEEAAPPAASDEQTGPLTQHAIDSLVDTSADARADVTEAAGDVAVRAAAEAREQAPVAAPEATREQSAAGPVEQERLESLPATAEPESGDAAPDAPTQNGAGGRGSKLGGIFRRPPVSQVGHRLDSDHRLEVISPTQGPVSREDLERAEQERLLSLRDDSLGAVTEYDELVLPAAPPRRPAPDASNAAAFLEFVTGMRAGETIGLDGDILTLGTSPRSGIILPDENGAIAREHARIWKHGDNFLLREVDGAGTTIGGHSLETPVVVLENRDEVQIGPYRLRFSVAAHAAPSDAGAEPGGGASSTPAD